MRGYVLSSAACGVSHIFPACGAPKFGVGPTPNLGRLYPCGSQNWDGRKKGACRHRFDDEVIRIDAIFECILELKGGGEMGWSKGKQDMSIAIALCICRV